MRATSDRLFQQLQAEQGIRPQLQIRYVARVEMIGHAPGRRIDEIVHELAAQPLGCRCPRVADSPSPSAVANAAPARSCSYHKAWMSLARVLRGEYAPLSG